MSLSTITLGGQQVTLVSRPQISLREVQWEINDAVALVTSPFTGQTQAQQWPGADMLRGTMTFPPLTQKQADQVIAFLMQCRGMTNGFLLGDPLKRQVTNAQMELGAPMVDGSVATNNLAGATQLVTKGWKPNAYNLLTPGDWIQLGTTQPIQPGSPILTGAVRLHRNLDTVNADANGAATLNLWPSLREQPADATAIVLHDTQGVFRMATNKRTWSADITRLSSVSFQVMEFR